MASDRKNRTIEELEHFKIWAHFMPKEPCEFVAGMRCYPQDSLEICWDCFDKRDRGL